MTGPEQVLVNVADLRLMKDYMEGGNENGAGAIDRLTAAIPVAEWEPTDDYRPPSVADGTVAPALVAALRTLGDSYGPTGVANVAADLAEWEPTDDMRAKYRRVWMSVPPDVEPDDILRAMHREGLL